MKSFLLSLVLLASGSMIVTPSLLLAEETSTKQVVILTINDAGAAQHEVALGSILEIQLENNPSIGNNWHFNNFSQEEVLYLGSPEDGSEINPQAKNLIGAPLTYAWNFTPTSTSVATTIINFNQTDRTGTQTQSIGFNISVVPAKPSSDLNTSH